MKKLFILFILFLSNYLYAEDIYIENDILSPQIWTSQNIYFIIDDINIKSKLIIESGTVIIYDIPGDLRVNDGGSIICGTDYNNPIIMTSLYNEWFDDYYAAIIMENTASPETKLTNLYITNAYIGIQLKNVKLNYPIYGNVFFHGSWGIYGDGPNDIYILNNLFFYNYETPIFLNLNSNKSKFIVQNNTLDYQYYGITVCGVPEPNNAGEIDIFNNVISRTYDTAVNLVDGYMSYWVTNNGYSQNYINKNFEFNEYNIYISELCPFYHDEYYENIYYYLNKESNFIDAGLGRLSNYPLIALTSTDIDGFSDKNQIDLGYHFPITEINYEEIEGDFDNDKVVDANDLIIFSENWLIEDANNISDINKDGIVNLIDFNFIYDNWLKTTLPPQIITDIPYNVSGKFPVKINAVEENIDDIYVYLDEDYVGKIKDIDEILQIKIDSQKYKNGYHSIQLASIIDGNLYYHPKQNIYFYNKFYYFDAEFKNNNYYMNGFYEGDKDLILKVENILNDEIIFEQIITGNSLNIVISENLIDYQPYKISIKEIEDPEQLMVNQTPEEYNAWEQFASRPLYIPPANFNDPNYVQFCRIRGLIILPDAELAGNRKMTIRAVQNAMAVLNNGPEINFLIIFNKNVNWDNYSRALQLPYVNYVYFAGHGGWQIEPRWYSYSKVPRQWVQIYDGEYVLSYCGRNTLNTLDDDLLNGYENNHSIADLNLYNSSKLKIVIFDSCFSNYTCEFPQALGMMSNDDIIHDQVFVGWNNFAFQNNMFLCGSFMERVWMELDEDESVFNAIDNSKYNPTVTGWSYPVSIIGIGGPSDISECSKIIKLVK